MCAPAYNAITGAFMQAARDFFGTNQFEFTVHSNAANADRSYTRFSDACLDTIEARILQGIHFRTAEVQGVLIGKRVARWLGGHALKAVR